MKFHRLILLILAGILLGALLLYQLVSWRLARQAAEDQLLENAERIRGVLMSLRRVSQHAFLESGLELNEKTLPLLPAFAMARMAEELKNFDSSGFSFNNVSDQARNHHNQADAEELKAIAFFREHPKAERYTAPIIDADGREKLLYARPIWIEDYCLKCHGKPEDAPPSIRARYPNAYGYKVGDLRGVLSIKLPREQVTVHAWRNFRWQLLISLIVFFAAGAFLVWRLRRDLARPLASVAAAAQQLATGDLTARAHSASTIDEVRAVADSFNRMATTLGQTQKALSESEARYRLLAEHARDCITFELPEGGFSYVSPAARAIFGVAPEALLRAHASDLLERIAPEDRRRWQEHLGHADLATEGMELRLLRPDGETVWIEHDCMPVFEEGRYLGRRGAFRDITARKHAEAEAERLAYQDALTGLPNRREMIERLAYVLATSSRQKMLAALILIDLSGFKRLNEARGEDFGNRVLIAVAERLQHTLREGDLVARTYGDEFALLLTHLDKHSDLATKQIVSVLGKLQQAIVAPMFLDGEELALAACFGITHLPTTAADSAEAALRRADTALHRAKAKGPGEYAFFEEAMGETARLRFEIEKALRQALLRDELRLYLQSQVDAAGRIIGAEVLLRWQHPERGLVPPGQFIPIAEESKLIVELGAWVLKEACLLIRRQLDAGRPLRLSVNLSARQFRQPGFERWLADLIEAHGADPALMTLEVTESLAIEDFAVTVGRMHALRAMGLHFSLDDFGTGYSSLAYLKRLPISELKIDKSFVLDAPFDADDAALVDTILGVARQLKLRVVAEGVETALHAAFLDGKGEIIRQGYHYGKPLPVEEWLAAWK
ncbi:EAL domain-containing protein [Sulfuricystis multivorans]|uniref:EAL domain-containing protein n=1 Tax=Sulfuricystis multivorans TaxID=2211108 RepID=UPI000F837FB6|nr:EAL domain-containing protein [Sulfuricystis multivorans]